PMAPHRAREKSPPLLRADQLPHVGKVPHQRPGLFYRPRPLLLIPNEQLELHQVNCLIGKSLSLDRKEPRQSQKRLGNGVPALKWKCVFTPASARPFFEAPAVQMDMISDHGIAGLSPAGCNPSYRVDFPAIMNERKLAQKKSAPPFIRHFLAPIFA